MGLYRGGLLGGLRQSPVVRADEEAAGVMLRHHLLPLRGGPITLGRGTVRGTAAIALLRGFSLRGLLVALLGAADALPASLERRFVTRLILAGLQRMLERLHGFRGFPKHRTAA